MIAFIFSFKLWVRKLIGFLYLLLIVVLSLMPANELPHVTVYKNFDKFAHFLMYLGLSSLVCWGFNLSRKKTLPLYFLFAGVFFWGVLMEILQRTMHNGRAFDFRDMLANLMGAIVGVVIYRMLIRRFENLKIR